jgi:hypothetical protein
MIQEKISDHKTILYNGNLSQYYKKKVSELDTGRVLQAHHSGVDF